ncbi:MAG: hypothetical protein C4530_03040 [Desulfobacteraceae bacterium]|nr:MAG: hypothetical protein C4530_03040 [Desulfobacteraceae bacterium]
MKLTANADKTTLAHVSEGIVYLGFHMDAKGKGPAKKSVEQLQAKLEIFEKVRKTDDLDEKLKEAVVVIRGWYNYYQTLSPIRPSNLLSLIAMVSVARDLGEVQLARQVLKLSTEFRCTHPELAFQLGELFIGFGMATHALREYAQVLQMEPGNEKAKEKIRLLQEGAEDVHQTIEKIQLVLHHNPHYREGYEKLVECYTEIGLHGFAEKAHQKLLELDAGPEEVAPAPFEAEPPPSEPFDYHGVDLYAFLNLFRGRTDAFARQWVDERGRWGFIRVEREMKERDIYKHLKGEETLAVYPVTAADTVHFIVFDVDTAKRALLESEEKDLDAFRKLAHEDLLRIKTVCSQMGLTLYVEDSGYKGRHGWLFFTGEIPAADGIRLGREIMKKAGGPAPGLIWELFPMGKSERHKSQIKLPLGINRKNNRRCLFLNDNNHPVKDQALLVKTIRKGDKAGVSQILAACRVDDERPDGFAGPAAPAKPPLSPGLDRMVKGCKILGHMISKAKDTNYLNHYERTLLLYTLTFAGDEGCDFLHRVIGYCINYDRALTQRQIEKRKESPISCARIKENFPELAETLGCDCRFDLPPKGYPSPVLYYLAGEIDGARFFPEKGDKDMVAEAETAEPSGEETSKIRVLDFDRIFSSEPMNVVDETTESDYVVMEVDNEQDDSDDLQDFPEKESQEAIEPGQPEILRDLVETADWTPAKCEPAPEIRTGLEWELFCEYLTLKARQQKIRQEIGDVEARLDRIFGQCEDGRVETVCGVIRRTAGDDGKTTWVIVSD